MNQVLPSVGTIQISVKREDLLHPHISGNKFRKLKYNILQAKRQGVRTLLTFGGAYSNHIAATAAAGKEYGFKTIGVIRGEELFDKIVDNPTLSFAKSCGMELIFVSRDVYRQKESKIFNTTLQERFGDFYLVPEGGTNNLAVKGCEEILETNDIDYTHICCAVGTGGTVSGIINSASNNQQVLGFPALKADLSGAIRKFAKQDNWALVTEYHFGGYGKINAGLVTFINKFYTETGVPLDPVYTGKMFFGVYDMIVNHGFPENSRILLIHTGGLQGIAGMNKELAKKKQPLIKIEI
ncbi:1-aminocyclopropane-1-carboxylate deaminase [Flavobacterium cyanobacteriorum]|uniref:1-aminocyclopropane-1-carboxylate deaminase n=1 Tax=Flavobacterium cyanobacteriorum TaxID=2022802 RepID=A0A255ZCD4_9FLAO|nr:pyridoxal-phosphate dependent enzyme [Flavobacterium cyanobacteriorum]OYQ38260.1 1-aminocyclopropane-1-carboxylate deaminase [Flavobacterium cyanobacteriorum]